MVLTVALKDKKNLYNNMKKNLRFKQSRLNSEAVTQRCSVENAVLEIS